jgi:16S rRNA (cytidine1402-2'-O)-methyltransferase
MSIAPGTLYIVATPIGNLEDITLRALRILGEVDLIACEDTRQTRKLLSHFKISTPMVSCHEHNERQRTIELIEKLQGGTSIALVSDAGTPLVSDPGNALVTEAIAAGVTVVPIPGPAALVTALSAAGLEFTEFLFAGFLPPKRGQRQQRLAELAAIPSTLVLYEAPHRLRETLADASRIMGNRPCAVARELTKIHEQFLRGTLNEVAEAVSAIEVRGEIVMIIGPAVSNDHAVTAGDSVPEPISEAIDALIRDEGLDQKSALKRIARARGISKSEAYRRLLSERR